MISARSPLLRALTTGLWAVTLISGCRPTSSGVPLPGDQPGPLWPGEGLAGLRAARPATVWCGAQVWLSAALPDPADAPDHVAEWIEITNSEPTAVVLTGWSLRAGRRHLSLGETRIGAGDTVRLRAGRRGAASLGSVRLRNTSGVVTLVDPCGAAVAALSWGCPSPAAGTTVVVIPNGLGSGARGPVRYEAIGTGGLSGCGQT